MIVVYSKSIISMQTLSYCYIDLDPSSDEESKHTKAHNNQIIDITKQLKILNLIDQSKQLWKLIEVSETSESKIQIWLDYINNFNNYSELYANKAIKHKNKETIDGDQVKRV